MNYVYFIRQANHDIFKIGASNDPNTRLPDLQVGNPYPLSIYHVIPCQDHYSLEGYIHKSISSQAMMGEWFKITAAEVDVLIHELTKGWRTVKTEEWGVKLEEAESFDGWVIGS